MKIKNFINNTISKYSSHFFVYSTLLPIFCLSILYYNYDNLHISQTTIWFFIITVIPILIPAYITFVIGTCYVLNLVELEHLNFRIQTRIIYNTFFMLIFYVLYFISICIIFAIICDITYSIATNENIRELFVTFGIPSMISILPINLFLYKFLHNTCSSKNY